MSVFKIPGGEFEAEEMKRNEAPQHSFEKHLILGKHGEDFVTVVKCF